MATKWSEVISGKGRVVSKEGPGIFLQGLAVYDRLGVLEKGEAAHSANIFFKRLDDIQHAPIPLPLPCASSILMG